MQSIRHLRVRIRRQSMMGCVPPGSIVFRQLLTTAWHPVCACFRRPDENYPPNDSVLVGQHFTTTQQHDIRHSYFIEVGKASFRCQANNYDHGKTTTQQNNIPRSRCTIQKLSNYRALNNTLGLVWAAIYYFRNKKPTAIYRSKKCRKKASIYQGARHKKEKEKKRKKTATTENLTKMKTNYITI